MLDGERPQQVPKLALTEPGERIIIYLSPRE
jgi:hypothetical protein